MSLPANYELRTLREKKLQLAVIVCVALSLLNYLIEALHFCRYVARQCNTQKITAQLNITLTEVQGVCDECVMVDGLW